jgi:hypothetical protein
VKPGIFWKRGETQSNEAAQRHRPARPG